MKSIALRGRHATGTNAFALVDDDLFESLARYRWIARPSASGRVYAVRVERGADGKERDIRMHREVLGYSGPLDVRHRNHVSLDNRRANLELATRSETVLGQRTEHAHCVCSNCGGQFLTFKRTGARQPRYCSDACESAGANARRRHAAASEATVPTPKVCGHCAGLFIPARPRARFCSERCRKAAKYRRQLAAGALSPSRRRKTSRTVRRYVKRGSLDPP